MVNSVYDNRNDRFYYSNDFSWISRISGIADRLLRVMSRHPILTCCIIGFLSGSLLDLDHIPYRIFHASLWVPIYIRGPDVLGQGRNLHGVALVGGGLMCAYAGGSVLLVVLEAWTEKAVAQLRTSYRNLRAVRLNI